MTEARQRPSCRRKCRGSIEAQSGYILLPVALAITLIATMAFLLNHESAINLKTLNNDFEAAQADYVVQAGMAHATWGVQRSSCVGDMTMTSVPFGQGSYSATVDAGGPTTTSYSLTPDRDTWIKEASPDENNAGVSLLSVKIKPGESFRALYHYDLSSIPSNKKVVTATAWFYVNQNDNQGAVTLHPITTAWTESDATWNTMSSNFESSVYGTISPQPVSGVWVTVNITALAQAWVNDPATNFGILLNATVSDLESRFTSKEAGASQRPYLQVTTADGDVSPVQITATGTTAGGVTRTLSRTKVPAYQPAATVTLQPDGAAGKDTWISEWKTTWNYGKDESLTVDGDGTFKHGLLQFNLSAIPTGAKVLSATLSLYQNNASSSGGTVEIRRILSSWTEGNQWASTGVANWMERDSGVPWGVAGGDYSSFAFASNTLPAGVVGWFEWDVTSLVGNWVAGTYNNDGLVLMGGGAVNDFTSSDKNDATLHPKLTIEYACECGSACLQPQGSGNVLLVVGDDINTTSSDAFKKTLFESWGYTVTLLDDQTSQSGFDSAEATHDVAYVSESSDPNRVWDKLTDAMIGVVNEEGGTNSFLGISSSSAWPVGSAINVIDNSHYITRTFPSGALDIYAAGMEGLSVSGTEAPGLQTLADWGGAGALVVLNQGAALDGGGSAAGRRVMLPLGREGSFNWAYLNNNGRLIVQRALQWGTGNAGGAAPKNLLLVVVDPSSLTIQEAAKKVLIEFWGYVVNVIDVDDSQAAFDTAVASNDVVFITEDINSSALGTKLVNANIGVVTEEDNLSDEFGLAQSIVWESGTSLDINNNSHYITSPFSLGPLTVLSASEALSYVSGTLAPDLGKPASTGSGYALVTLGSGATTYAGGTAAGRRAQLPWGGNDFDVNNLTADGQTLMRRALEWGTGAGCGSLKPLLLVVSDASNPTSTETARKTLMESWCYQVTLIDDDATTGELATAMALNDVIYVSQEITTLSVATKLKDASIGIVNEEYLIGDDLGLAAGTGSGFYNDMNVVDNSHYITSGFGLGALALFDPAYDIYTGAGFTLAPDLQVLGEAGSMSVLVALESGGALYGGGTAAGRRVQVAWGDDFGALNTDGQALMQRAIEWAASMSSGGTGPTAHWKMDDGSGGTAVDLEGGHNGTLVGDLNWVSGQLDGGLLFDGLDDYVNVPHDDTLSLTTFSISAWIRPDALSGWQIVVNKGTTTSAVNYYLATNGDEIGLGFYNGGWEEFNTTSANLSTGQWYHIAATFDDATGEGKIYLDGVLVHSSTTVKSPLPNGEALTIGRSGFGEYWPGTLDDIRIYDRVLDIAEVSALAGVGGGGGGPTGVVFEEFTEASLGSDGTSLSISKPASTAVGDLLVAAVATDGKTTGSLSPPTGWNVINVDDRAGKVTFGVWWKLAGATESSSYTFNWSNGEEAYGWIMRFTGHDLGTPINADSNNIGANASPPSPSVTTTVDNTLILRMGGFDEDDINIDAPGLTGHTAITMDKSDSSGNTSSGGAGYLTQASAGSSGASTFSLTASEEYVTVTIAIAPDTGG